ncbi:MAG: MFS transporter [Anaerolineae bacterium]|nr:MFS transporter [Anaerolineae bacterium]
MLTSASQTKKSAYPVYLLLTGLTALSFTLVFTVNMIYQVTVVELNPLQLVLVGTLLEGTVFVFEVPTGIVADVYSRRLSIIIGVCLTGIAFVVEGSIPAFAAVLIAQVLWGIGYTFTSGATEAWIADEVGDERAGDVFMRGSQIGMIAGLVGIPISTGLGYVHIQLPIILGGVSFLLLGIVLRWIMPETGFMPTPPDERESWRTMVQTFRAGLRLIRGRTILLIFVGITLFYGLSSEGFDRLWTAHILEDFTFPDVIDLKPVVWFGLIGVVKSVLALGVTEIVRRRLQAGQFSGMARLLLVANALLILAIWMFGLTGSFWIALIAYLTVRVLQGVSGPVFTAWINPHIDSKVRATVYSMAGQVDAIGQVAGGPGVGYIGSAWSIRAALVAGGILLSPVLWLFGYAVRHEATITPGVPAVEPAGD